ncbi:MAG: hypothetical protein Q4F00_02755 [bacterium]|nr:hypothetical protein [bacterium]
MSKGDSGLFKGTSGTKAAQAVFVKKVLNSIKELIAKTHGSHKKSMIAGAYDSRTGKIASAFAGSIPTKIHPELLNRANSIGGLGTHGLTNKNIVGVCAEFHVVNELLLNGSKWSDIHLVTAIRPRTGLPMPFCANCLTMFKDIIN